MSALGVLIVSAPPADIENAIASIAPRLAKFLSSNELGSVLLIGALIVPGWIMGASLIDGRPVDQIEPADRQVIAAMDDVDGRVYSPSFDLVGVAAAQADIETLHGVDPFQFQWSAEAIAEAAGIEMAGYSVVSPPVASGGEVDPVVALQNADPDVERLAVLDVSHIVSHFPIEADGLEFVDQVEDVYLYQVDSADFDLPPFVDVEWETTPNRLTAQVSADSATTLIVPVAWAPGWRASINGEAVPVRRVSGALIGICLPAGESEITLVYRPMADLVGAAISGVTALSLLVMLIVRTVRKAGNGKRK